MAELTLQSLNALIDQQNEKIAAQDLLIEEQDKKIADLTDLIASGKAVSKESGSKKAELPKIPEELVKVGSKEYKWNVAAFHLPGDPNKYTAEVANTDQELLKKIIAIKGQNILKEQA